jgi:hypothetical protein
MNRTSALALAILVAAGGGLSGQETAKQRPVAFKVDVTIHQIEGGKRVNARGYMMLVDGGGKGSQRVGQRVPYATGVTSQGVPMQYQYMDLGVNIDCAVREQGDAVLLDAGIEISDIEQPESKGPLPPSPTVRSTRFQVSRTVLAPGQKTLIAGADSPAGKQRYEIEVLVTRVP